MSEAAGAPDLVTYDEAINRLRSLPVEQRMTALGMESPAEAHEFRGQRVGTEAK